MFNKGNRYITSGIQNEIPLEIQQFIWNCIDVLKDQGKVLDYLQVFEITKERIADVLVQKIEHTQEIPKYKMTYKVFFTEMVDDRIFVIDDKEYSTMMLSTEY